MATFQKKSRKPIELSSIINVVQRSPKSCHKSSHHKMEVKSVVHVKSDRSKTPAKTQSRQDHKSSRSSKMDLEKPMLLLPFGHQVSGRASMLCYDETTILKPYVSRELFFYQSMPQKLKHFTPQFRGLVSVSFVEDSATTSSMLAYALPCTLVKPNAKSIIKLFAEEPKPHSKRCVKDFGKTHVIYPDQSMDKIVLCDDDGKDCSLFVEPVNFDAIISTDQDDDVVSDLSQGFDSSVCIDDTTESSKENRSQQKFSTTGLQNPWNAKVLDDAWVKLKVTDGEDDPSSGKKKRFTLLENVVARYRRPCVLDLKIGTRIRENASDDKVARHVTAINIGARLSGMQIYQPEKEQFSYHNKYYGHNLSIAGFKANLRHFFSRGTYPVSTKKELGPKAKIIDRNLVKEAIRKLKKLKDIIASMQSHRFYSSSLLLLYEGDVDVSLSTLKDTMTSSHGCSCNNSLSPSMTSASMSDVTRISAQSFSFSEFLQRLKHDDTHGKECPRVPDAGDHDDRISRIRERDHEKHDLDSQKSGNKYQRPGQSSQFKSSRDRKSSKKHSTSSNKTNYIRHEPAEIELPCGNHSHEKVHNSHKTRREGDLSSRHKPVTSQHPDSAVRSQIARKSSDSRGKTQTHGVNCHGGMPDVDSKRGRTSSGHPCCRISESKPQIPYSWKSWPTRSKRMKMNSIITRDNESFDFNDNVCHETDCIRGCRNDSDSNQRDAIDVRMIDFAHYCFCDSTMHPGPDKGFIFGLDNLIILLNDMLKL